LRTCWPLVPSQVGSLMTEGPGADARRAARSARHHPYGLFIVLSLLSPRLVRGADTDWLRSISVGGDSTRVIARATSNADGVTLARIDKQFFEDGVPCRAMRCTMLCFAAPQVVLSAISIRKTDCQDSKSWGRQRGLGSESETVSTFRFGSTFVHHLTESNFFHAFPRRIIQLYTWDSTTGKFYLVAWRLVQTRDYPLNVGELAGRVGPADSGKAGVTDLSYLHIVFTEAAEVAMALGVPQGLAKHMQTLGPPTFDSDLGPACPVYPGGRAAQVLVLFCLCVECAQCV